MHLVVAAGVFGFDHSASRDVVDVIVVPDVVSLLGSAVVNTNALARFLEMAVVSATSGFAVGQVGGVGWVSNALLEGLGSGHGRDDCDDGNEGEEDVGELHGGG